MSCLIPVLIAYFSGVLTVLGWGLYLSAQRDRGQP